MKTKYFFLFMLITFTLVICGCNKANNNNSNTKSNISKDFTFEKLPDMPTPRAKHTAITMKNGKVLIVGNWWHCPDDLAYSQKQADLYDPKTKTFSTIGKTNLYYNSNPTALNLPDGKVLLINQCENKSNCLNEYSIMMELFNPETLEFNLVKNFQPFSKNAFVLKNGNVLFTNGKNVEVYDPKTWKLLKTARSATIKGLRSFILLGNDSMLIFDGKNQIETYNPKTNKFNIVGHLMTQKYKRMFLLLKNETVLIKSGENDFEIYDPKTNETREIGTTETNFGKSGMLKQLVLNDGKVLLYAGGIVSVLGNEFIVEIFDPDTSSFKTIHRSNNVTKYHELTLLKDGNILVTGGIDQTLLMDADENIPIKEARLIIVNKGN